MRTRKSRRRGRLPSRALPTHPVPPANRPAYPRGNALTDSVALTDAHGTSWLVYVEPVAPEASFRRSAALLPGRRLRFDSLDRSLTVACVPAGAPFLPEGRLLGLLARAEPLSAPLPPGPAAVPVPPLRSVDWAGSVAAMAGAGRAAAARWWRSTGDLRRMGTRGLVHLVAPAALLLVVLWEALLVRSRARI